jgi:UDP-glucuronate 4-epimerase
MSPAPRLHPLSTSRPVLITGVAGFIGRAVARILLDEGHEVCGCDNLNSYYDPALKLARLQTLAGSRFRFKPLDLADWGAVQSWFDEEQPHYVIHLAAQAGVRYALTNPKAYADSNLTGSSAVLEACRQHAVKHLVFASSSSVYGSNQKVPFSESDPVDHPISFYAASKRSNELMAHSYSHLFNLPITMLRFFTVYGPWGRPDMAIWKFTEAILKGQPIDVYAEGVLSRDFTYIDDIAQGTLALLANPSKRQSSADPKDWTPDGPASSWAPFETFNIGRSDPVTVNHLIQSLESIIGRKAVRNFLPMQAGDVERTYADTSKLSSVTGYRPAVSLEEGLAQFVRWYREYRGIATQ